MQYEELQCHYCGKELTEEEACGVLDEIACEKCKDVMETILEEDKQISALNNKYTNANMTKFFSGLGVGGLLILMPYWLEDGSSTWVGGLNVLLILVCLIVFTISAIRKSSLGKRIKRELNIEYGRRMGTIHHTFVNRGEEHIC